MSAINGTFSAVPAAWNNLLTLLQGKGYPGRSALVQCSLAPAGTCRVKRHNSNVTAPVSATDGIGIGAAAIGGPTFEWNYTRQGGFLEASQTWIYGDGGDIEFDVAGAEW